MGEKLLFPDFDGFVNLGGICNASLISKNSVIAGDVGPFNQVFNHFAQKIGFSMDEGDSLSQSGNRVDKLIDSWKNNPFFKETFPKSLANQWVTNHFLGIENIAPEDVLHSFAHFITDQLSDVLNYYSPERVLVTGGGTYNQFVMSLLKQKCTSNLIKPSNELINYKESLMFGFLGLLRMRGDNNVLSSATGASRDSSSGTIYRP
jgi:anhydro-N-acetylmuramic acid kinase